MATRRWCSVAVIAAWLASAMAVASPYLVIETEEEWLAGLSAGRIEPVHPPEWNAYQSQWTAYRLDGPPYPAHQYLPPESPTGELYVYGGGGGGAYDPADAGLVMLWGNAGTPPGSYSSSWEYAYGLDPDLTNCTITVSVTPPPFINVVSFGIKDIAGNNRAWYWNVSAAGPLKPGVPNTVTINTSATGVTATGPVATAYMSHPAFDITQAQSFIFDENSNWVGTAGIPAPGSGTIGSWNYWHGIAVTPFQGVVKWAQPPVYSDLSPMPNCYYGWDETSAWQFGPILADDFLCGDDRPIRDIHWWGSYANWMDESPPPRAPAFFRIGIWSDVAVGPANPLPFSHPGTLVKEWVVPRAEVYERRVGCDFHPAFMPQPDTCFQYDYFLPEAEWFWQPDASTVYWLSIAAVYPDCACNGNVNGDNFINAADLSLVLAHFGDPAGCPACDINCDGAVDVHDVVVLQCQMGQPPPGDPSCCTNAPTLPPNPWGWKTRPHNYNDDAVRLTAPTAPEVGDAFASGAPVMDQQGVSWDMAFVLTTDRANPPASSLKWDQPPVSAEVEDVFYGWNEYSVWAPSTELGVLAADDWVCVNSDPITKIRWWGSFIGWTDATSPPPLPNTFRIHIWTDVPAGGTTDFSHPGQVIHEIVATGFTAQFVGWDYNPATKDYEAAYLFEQDLAPNEYFYQPGTNTIHWISIAAQYDVQTPQYPFGWKTKPRDPLSLAPDAAVRVFEPASPAIGGAYVSGEPIFWPARANTWDLAFELIATPQSSEAVKWEQPPDLAPTGLDVNAGPAPIVQPTGFVLADDYRCTQTGPVMEIQIYGSWWHDQLPVNAAGAPDASSVRFTLSVHDDVPDPDGTGPLYSHPGAVLWSRTFAPGSFSVQQFASNLTEGWLTPPSQYEPIGDHTCWLYTFPLLAGEFVQQGTTGAPKIYWVDVQADPVSLAPGARFGWKTTVAHFLDDAVWGIGREPFTGPWNEQRYPTGHPRAGQSLDLAFNVAGMSGFKWQRAPDLAATGLDVDATITQATSPQPYILADDFQCTHTGPITDFHIYGSWLNDYLPYGGDPTAVTFTLSIHADIPASQSPTGYSMPGAVLWSQTFTPGEFGAMPFADFLQEGWLDPPSGYVANGDTRCWRYDFNVEPTGVVFVQQQGTVYWLDVQAVAADANAKWGWKSSTLHWNDDATWVQGAEPYAGTWNELRYPAGHPMAGQSIDLAYALTTQMSGEPYLKWSQPPTPYEPTDGFTGWNEVSMYGGPQIVADDWVCTNAWPITDVHWWGSFLGWGGKVMPHKPRAFHLAVWTDVPPGSAGDPFSHPGAVLWQALVTDYNWKFVGWDWDPRGPAAPEACFKFDAYLSNAARFQQPEGDHIYWLSISAVYDAVPNQYPWGWKTRPHDPLSPAPDDAVAIWNPLSPIPGAFYAAGGPLWWPTPADSWDMAFQLTTLPMCLDADVNCDGSVNGSDILSVRAPGVWSASGAPGFIRADVNNDGKVNGSDILSIRAPGTWNASTGPCNCGP